MNMVLPPVIKGEEEKRKNIKQIPPSSIDRMAHDIVNHLSVICLCCCELRNSVAEKLEAEQLKEFQRIEIAVQAAAKTIQELRAVAKDQERMLNARLKPVQTGDSFCTILAPTLHR